VNVPCPCAHQPARRETRHDGHLHCSSWYYLRYSDPHNTSCVPNAMPATAGCLGPSNVAALSTRFCTALFRFVTKVLRDKLAQASMNPSSACSPRAWCRPITYKNRRPANTWPRPMWRFRTIPAIR